MNEIIKIENRVMADEVVPTVSGRDFHAFLGVGKDFSTWVKDRIEQYGFIENRDFVIFTDFGEKSGKGRPAKEYAFTISMAKELAMVERNDKGKEARLYFIECERRAKAQSALNPANLTRLELLQMALEAEQQRLALEQKVQEVEHERDEAIRQRALIGAKREATAMATASREARRAEILKRQLDQSNEWATVRRREKLYPGRKFNWHLLVRTSRELGIEPVKVPDPLYGEVNSYHADIWREVYGIEIPGGTGQWTH